MTAMCSRCLLNLNAGNFFLLLTQRVYNSTFVHKFSDQPITTMAFFILMHKISQVMASLMCSLKRLNKTQNITIVCILYDAISNIQTSLEIIHWTNMQNILSASVKESGNKQITCPLYFIFRGEKGANNNFVRCPILHQQGGWYMFSYFKSRIAVIVQRLK